MRAAKYRVTLRHGTARDYTSKREAMRAYRAEVRDRWASNVTDLTTGMRDAFEAMSPGQQDAIAADAERELGKIDRTQS